jgi:hypothetical protein
MSTDEIEVRSNFCFKCGGPVGQIGPAHSVIVAICDTCRSSFMEVFQRHIAGHDDWRWARVEALTEIYNEKFRL